MKPISNSTSDPQTSLLLLVHGSGYIMFLYIYKQDKSLIGRLGSAFGWLCCFSCLKGMAFVNMERELDFYFVIIHIAEVGTVIITGIPLIPEAVGLK